MKSPNARQRVNLTEIESDFNHAIDRLIEGKPTNPDLQKIAARKKLAITPTTVAMEAGRSRTLIALKQCRLPLIRRRVLSLSGDVLTPRLSGSAAEIARLKEENAALKLELAAAIEAQGEHFLARERAERGEAKWRDAYRRSEQEHEGNAKVSSIR